MLTNCGEPTQKDTRQKVILHKDLYGNEIRNYTRIEDWHYDLGVQNFTENLRFENDILRFISTGSYGGVQKENPNLCNATSSAVKPGMLQIEIKIKCCEPSQKNHIEDRINVISQAPLIEESEMISVEEWVYNFGLEKPVSILRFENNILRQVRQKLS